MKLQNNVVDYLAFDHCMVDSITENTNAILLIYSLRQHYHVKDAAKGTQPDLKVRKYTRNFSHFPMNCMDQYHLSNFG